MPAAHRCTICIFAKAPQVGAVKTRLAATIGPEAAAVLARAFFSDTLALAERVTEAGIVVALSGDAALLPALNPRVTVWPQGDGDLGARLERGMHRALLDTRFAIALGTDSPGLPLARIEEALTSLEDHDAVLGPADDGGFYLLGLKRCPEGLLAELPWSATNTRERTIRRLRERQLRVAMLPAWFDVDVAADLSRLRSLLESGQLDAPATAHALGVARKNSVEPR